MFNINSLINRDFYYNGRWLSDFGGEIAGSNGMSPFSVLPQLDIKSESVIGMDGQLVYGSSYQPRTFVVPVYFKDLTRIREIASWLSTKQPTDFYFKGDDVKISVLLDSAIDIQGYCLQGTVELKFIAHNPYYSAVDDEKFVVVKSAQNKVTKVGSVTTMEQTSLRDIQITNKGTINSYPMFTIYGTGEISVGVNGEVFTVRLGTTDDYVTVDTQRYAVYKDNTNRMNDLITDTLPALECGINRISVGDNCTKIEIQCNSKWI